MINADSHMIKLYDVKTNQYMHNILEHLKRCILKDLMSKYIVIEKERNQVVEIFFLRTTDVVSSYGSVKVNRIFVRKP